MKGFQNHSYVSPLFRKISQYSKGFLYKQRVTVPLEEGLTATAMATPIDIVYQKKKRFAIEEKDEKMITIKTQIIL